MARVKIQYPEKSLFETEITIAVQHLNYGNHVGNDRFLGICHEARLRYLKSIEQGEINFFGTSLIMSDAELAYKAQAFHGDTLTISLAAKEINSKAFDFFYKIVNQKDELVCLAKTGMVYYNYESNSIECAPKEWLIKLI